MENLKIENADIGIRCFGGNDKFNPGKRYFFVRLDEDVAEALKNDGWNVKIHVAHDDYETIGRLQREGWNMKLSKLEKAKAPDPVYTLQVDSGFEHFPPRIFVIADGQKTLLTEETVGQLDGAEIETVDMIIRPRAWQTATKSGIKAYLKTMYVTIVTDDLDKKYAGIKLAGSVAAEDDDVPFDM